MFATNPTLILPLIILLFLGWGGSFLGIAWAQQADALPVEDALRTRHYADVSPPQFSPDGKWLAIGVNDNGKTTTSDSHGRLQNRDRANGNDIWVLNTETGEATNLTKGEGDNWDPKWSPDGRFLAFLSNRDGSGYVRLWVWDRTKNDPRRVSDINVITTRTVEWSTDGRAIFATVVPKGMTTDAYIEKVQVDMEGQKAVVQKAVSSTVRLYKSSASGLKDVPTSDPWNLNRVFGDLVRIDLLTGQAAILVSGQRIETYKLSPNGTLIAFTVSKRFEKAGNGQELFDLITVDTATNQQRLLVPDIPLNYDGAQFSWSPNGTLISYHVGGWEKGSTGDCYIVSVASSSARNITNFVPQQQPDLGVPSVPLWDESGSYIYFVKGGALWHASVSQEKASQLARIPNHKIWGRLIAQSTDLLWTVNGDRSTVVMAHDDVGRQDGFYQINLTDGVVSTLLEKGQCYTCSLLLDPAVTTPDGRNVAYLAEDAQHDSDLWLNDETFDNPKRLTHFNPQFEKYKLGAVQLIDWLSDDGERLHGALLLPSDYSEGKRYPLVVGVYGGGVLSNSLDHFGFAYGEMPLNMQLLATRGYAVLFPDSPSHEGTPMADLAKTVLPGVNRVIEMGIADPERLGIMGHSNGGYSTLALIVQTSRFKAAVEMDGFGDLAAMYGEMDKDGTAYATTVLEHNSDVMGGTPWEFRERYVENSPFFYLDRTRTPLLIIHGAADSAVGPFLGDQIFVALRRLGKEVEYAKYEGERHIPITWSYANQMDVCNRTVAWFEQYLKQGN